jgi:hypothetical protein
MWSLTSPRAQRMSGPEKIRSSSQKRTFSTVSALFGLGAVSDLSPLTVPKQTLFSPGLAPATDVASEDQAAPIHPACGTSLADSTEGRKKPAMRPNDNDQRFLASYFEFVDSDFINEPRPNIAKGHERVFLRTHLSNFPTICTRQRIADSIAGFLVDRYVAFKRSTRRGPNKSLVIYPHPFLNFARIDFGHGSGRAHSKGRHNGCKCGVKFQSNHFPNWLVILPGGTRIHYIKHCSGKVTVVSTSVQHSCWTRIKKLYHANDHKSATRGWDCSFFLGSAIAQVPSTATRGRTCTKL